LFNKRLKSPFSIKEKLNKEKPYLILFPTWKILSNSIKRQLILDADKKLIQG
jgi:hypothetical protein